MASNHENSHGGTWSTGHLRDKDGCPAFPGEAYTVTQFNSWLREFRGYAARKGYLSVLLNGSSDEPTNTPAEQQLANRRANSALYGLLILDLFALVTSGVEQDKVLVARRVTGVCVSRSDLIANH